MVDGMRGERGRELHWLRTRHPDAVAAVAALQKWGIDSATAYRRCLPGGPWRWMLPGVVLLASGTATWRQRVRAALVYAGPRAQLSGSTAARLYGLQRVGPDDQVHVLVPHERRRRSAGYTLVERTKRLPAPVLRDGLPCAPVARAVLDRARRLRDVDAVQALLAEVVQRGLCTAELLLRETEAGSSRGTALVRRELHDILGGARSVAEVRAKRLARRSGLPAADWNVGLVDQAGRPVGWPDAWWPDVGLAWEIDSHDFHLTPADHARSVRRDARYAGHGVTVLPTIPSRLTKEPDAVVAELRAAYAAAARRPRPVVFVEPRPG